MSSNVADSRVKMQQGPGRNRKAIVWARESFVVHFLPSVFWHCGITYRVKM